MTPSNHKGFRAIAFSLVVAGAALWHFAPERRLDLLRRVQQVQAISDRFHGGTSNSHAALIPGGIRFQFALDDPDRHPWAGINLRLADSSHPPIDLGAWRALRVRTVSTPHTPLRIQLLSDDLPPGATQRDSIHPLYHIVEYSPSNEPQEFAWGTFQIPSWWRDQTQRVDQQRLDLLDRLRSIEIHNGFSTVGPDSSSIDLLAIELVGPNRVLQGLGLLLVLLGTGALIWTVRTKRSSHPMGEPLPLPGPSPVTLDDPRARQRESLLAALRKSFSDPELNLESFAATQGLSSRLVSTLLKEATSLHFKGILNELRLTEAARLLREDRGNVSEIGFAVGFQNASHFGRAFREKFGKSPSDYRNEQVT